MPCWSAHRLNEDRQYALRLSLKEADDYITLHTAEFTDRAASAAHASLRIRGNQLSQFPDESDLQKLKQYQTTQMSSALLELQSQVAWVGRADDVVSTCFQCPTRQWGCWAHAERVCTGNIGCWFHCVSNVQQCGTAASKQVLYCPNNVMLMVFRFEKYCKTRLISLHLIFAILIFRKFAAC